MNRKCACGGSGRTSCSCGSLGGKPARGQEPPDRGAFEEAPAIVAEVLGSQGEPLDLGVRSRFEPSFGRDFSKVRIHNDSPAAKSASAVHALAYTVGSDIVFASGQFAPFSAAGSRLLAHELAHVVQQNGLHADGHDLQANQEIAEPATPLEQEADRMADLAVKGLSLPPQLTSARRALQRACPTPPTGLGRTRASEDCTPASADVVVSGSNLLFCHDSDELSDGQTGWFRQIVTDAGRATSVEIHGNASQDGPAGNYNSNLACKRAVAIANVMRASGVSVPIRLFSHGATGVYGPAPANRNVVIVLVLPPAPEVTPEDGDTPRDAGPPPAGPQTGRDLQVYCVTYIRGGCSGVPGVHGVPGDEDVARYDQSCRSDSGYTGAPLTLADLHCDELGMGIAHSLDLAHPGWLNVVGAEPCPCTLAGAQSAGFEESNSFIGTYHPGAANCYRKDVSGTVHAQQCCYDTSNNLITSGSGAGTPDVWSSGGHFWNHQHIDVEPWRTLGWQGYNRFWIPDNGNNCPANEVSG